MKTERSCRRLDGKRPKELMSSSSLSSGMSQLSNSSSGEETIEPFVHATRKSDTKERYILIKFIQYSIDNNQCLASLFYIYIIILFMLFPLGLTGMNKTWLSCMLINEGKKNKKHWKKKGTWQSRNVYKKI